MLPQSNAWAYIGGLVTTVLVFILQALVRFFAGGAPWPATLEGWATIVIPALAAGLLAALTPSYSHSEAKLGYRVTRPRDAPVLNSVSEHLRQVEVVK